MKLSSSGVRLMLRVGIGSLLRREYACWQSLPTGVFGLKNVESLEFDKANAGDSFDLAQSFNSSVGSGCMGNVDLHHGQGLTLRDALRTDGAAQGEVGDVDRMVAEDGSNAADDARNVVVADGDQGPGERSLDVDAIVSQQARRASMEDGGRGAGVALGGVEDDLQDRARASRGELLLVFLDADAALLRDGGGVDSIDRLRVGEDAGDGGVADEVGLAGGDATRVGDLDVFQIAGGGVREEVAEALGHLDIGGDLDVLLMREAGEVDGVLDDAELEVVANLHGELDADGLLGLVGGSGDVRGEDDVVEVVEDRLFERLLVEDVEGRAGDLAGLERFGERLFDDELAAGAVHDAYALLHDGERGGVDEALCLRGEADVEREVVGLLEDLVDGDESDIVLARDNGRDEGVVADEFHAEGAGAAGDL